jgi:hypothetical protein
MHGKGSAGTDSNVVSASEDTEGDVRGRGQRNNNICRPPHTPKGALKRCTKHRSLLQAHLECLQTLWCDIAATPPSGGGGGAVARTGGTSEGATFTNNV